MSNYFDKIAKVNYEGANSTNPFAFKHYNPNEVILGKTVEEHLRLAVCYWHTFCWTGNDMFGAVHWIVVGKKQVICWLVQNKKQKLLLNFSKN